MEKDDAPEVPTALGGYVAGPESPPLAYRIPIDNNLALAGFK
jgi:hypothetical protein